MFSISSRRCLIPKPRGTTYRLPRATFPAYISQTTRHRENNTSDRSGTSSGSDGKRQKSGGSYTRILAVFALGIPIGWGVKSLNESEGTPKTAKPTDFVHYALTRREPISSTCSIFTLIPAQGSAIDHAELYDPRAITSVQFKQPQLQIARSYTVLPPIEGQASDELRFLIRKEQRGEVSGYLHRLPLGATIEMRGPSIEYVLPENVTEVVFLAGGTGIAPALQIANTVVKDGQMRILWANRRREDCLGGVSDMQPASSPSWSLFSWWHSPPAKPTPAIDTSPLTNGELHPVVSQLESMRRLGSTPDAGLLVDYYVDEEGTFIRPADVSKALNETSRRSGSRLLLVSGPEGFVNYWAGPKQWVEGREVQGPLGGALAKLDLQGWKVIKL